MALTVGTVRDGLKTRLATISGLRAHDTMPDSVNPPAAVVIPRRVEFDLSMGRGVDRMTFGVVVLVSRTSERSGQDQLDGYLNSSGSTSVKAAIEGDKTLGGACADCRVVEAGEYGSVQVGSAEYLSVEFTVEVIG